MKVRLFDVVDSQNEAHVVAAHCYAIVDGFVTFYHEHEHTDTFYQPVSVLEAEIEPDKNKVAP